MRILLILSTALLAACTTVPVTRKFPDVPVELTLPCPDLDVITGDSIVLSQLSKNIVGNYTKYHKCAAQVDAWNEWYITQRKNFESVK